MRPATAARRRSPPTSSAAPTCWRTSEGAATYIGYSMGGRLCLHARAGRSPTSSSDSCWSAPPAASPTPPSAPPGGHRTTRSRRPIERDGVEAFLTRWVAQPLFAGLADPDLEDRRRNTAAGLASSLRLAGTGTQEPLWDRLQTIGVPVLIVAGALDPKFVAAAERMAALLPRPELVVIPGAGHTVHLERPDAFTAALDAWLSST